MAAALNKQLAYPCIYLFLSNPKMALAGPCARFVVMKDRISEYSYVQNKYEREVSLFGIAVLLKILKFPNSTFN